MPTVELVYDPECPNVSRTRVHLHEAFAQAGLVPQWSEHDVNDPSIPAHARNCGSPTVLVDGRDILEIPATDRCTGARCRLYRDGEGKLGGVPAVKDIVAAIVRGSQAGQAPWLDPLPEPNGSDDVTATAPSSRPAGR